MNDGQKSLFSLRNGITANNFNKKKKRLLLPSPPLYKCE